LYVSKWFSGPAGASSKAEPQQTKLKLKKAPEPSTSLKDEDDDTKQETIKAEDVEMTDLASEVDVESKPGQ
jgi:hypothetical protein